MRRMIFALALIALSGPTMAADLFTLSATATAEYPNCKVRFMLGNHSGRAVDSFSATVSAHAASGASLGARSLRFEYVDRGNVGVDTLMFSERCENLPALKLRAVDRCVLAGQRVGDCLQATNVEGDPKKPWPVNFTR